MYCLHGQVCRPPVAGMQCRQHDVPAVTHQQRCCTKILRTRRRQRQCCAQATQADAAHQARADLVQLKRELQAAVEAEVSGHFRGNSKHVELALQCTLLCNLQLLPFLCKGFTV